MKKKCYKGEYNGTAEFINEYCPKCKAKMLCDRITHYCSDMGCAYSYALEQVS